MNVEDQAGRAGTEARRDLLNKLLRARAPEIAADPRVRPTIRIGGIGRRRIDPAALDKVIAKIKHALIQIQAATADALGAAPVRELFDGPLDLVIVSPLAEGADRLIVNTAIELGGQIGAILPFEAPDYEATFTLNPDPAPAVAEFRRLLDVAASSAGYGVLVLDGDPSPEGRDAAYQNCATAVTRWSDILFAVLEDPQEVSQTGLSVEEAILMGVPVLVINPSGEEPFRLAVDGEFLAPADSEQGLRTLIRRLLGSAKVEHAGHAEHGGSGLTGYVAERITCDTERPCDFEYQGPYRAETVAPWWIASCAGLNGWIDRALRRLTQRAEPPPAVRAETMPFDEATASSFVALFLRYHRADVAASAYASLYRSAQAVIVLLAVLTGVFAILDIGIERPWFAILEFLTLFCALTLVRIAHRQRWLYRWLDYRLVAEVFRYAKFLLVTGRPSPFADLRGLYGGEDSARTWTRDHCQHVLRAHHLGMPGRGRILVPHAVEAVRAYIVANCFEDQLRYHRWTAVHRDKMGHLLQTSAVLISVVTLLAVLGNVVLKSLSFTAAPPEVQHLVDYTEFLAALLPAVTAALLAFRSYGEHTVVARRSRATIRALLREQGRLARADGVDTLGRHTVTVARILLRDIDGWLDLFADKHIET